MNKLFKAMIFDNQLSLSVLETTDMVNDAIKIHSLSPLAAAALGRTLTVATFMSSGLKNEGDKLSVVVAGDGVGGKITVCGNGRLDMRGTIENPQCDLPLKSNGKLDVGGCVGKKGRISVVKSMGLKEQYSGTSALISGEIAEDFTGYYAISEQQPTAMALGVKIGKDCTCIGAGGVIIQALPFAEEKNLIEAEKIINSLKNVSSVIEEGGAEKVIRDYFGGIEYEEYLPKPGYRCLCSREYIEKILISLGKKEIDEIIAEKGKVEVDCEFCRKKYEFTKEQADGLFGL